MVTAGHPGSNVSVSVITGSDGRYAFPADKLAPGAYYLSIRATGYDLDGDGAAQVKAKQSATADLKLKPTHDLLAAQLINAEWIASFPGIGSAEKHADQQAGCHTLARVALLDAYGGRMGF